MSIIKIRDKSKEPAELRDFDEQDIADWEQAAPNESWEEYLNRKYDTPGLRNSKHDLLKALAQMAYLVQQLELMQGIGQNMTQQIIPVSAVQTKSPQGETSYTKKATASRNKKGKSPRGV